MTYNTGDDVAYEMCVILLIVSVLVCNPGYVNAISLPPLLVVVLTYLVGASIIFVSQGRIFWGFFFSVGWMLVKLGVVKREEPMDYAIVYDEEGWPRRVEKKQEVE